MACALSEAALVADVVLGSPPLEGQALKEREDSDRDVIERIDGHEPPAEAANRQDSDQADTEIHGQEDQRGAEAFECVAQRRPELPIAEVKTA